MHADGRDPLRDIIRAYAFDEVSSRDMHHRLRKSQRRRRHRGISRLSAAAVLLIMVGALALWILSARGPDIPPVGPTPSPTIPVPSASGSRETTPTPAPTSTRPSSDSPSAGAAYPTQRKRAEGKETGGVGDTVNGVRLDDVEITSMTCTDADRCPDTGTLTVSNVTAGPVTVEIRFNVFRNNTEAAANGQIVTLDAGASATVEISVQPGLQDSAPPGMRGSQYSWNFSVWPSP